MAGKRSIVNPVLLYAGFVLLILNPSPTGGQETTNGNEASTETSTDPKECARELLDWCRGRNYSNYTGLSVSVVSVYEDGKQFAVTCITTGSNGTECSKNDESWFHCYPDGTLTYKDQPLTEETDDLDTCKARDKAVGLVRNVKQGREDFQRAMQELSRHMEDMRRRMMNMHRSFFGGNFPFGVDYDNDNDRADYDDDSYNRYDVDSSRRSTSRETEGPGRDREP